MLASQKKAVTAGDAELPILADRAVTAAIPSAQDAFCPISGFSPEALAWSMPGILKELGAGGGGSSNSSDGTSSPVVQQGTAAATRVSLAAITAASPSPSSTGSGTIRAASSNRGDPLPVVRIWVRAPPDHTSIQLS